MSVFLAWLIAVVACGNYSMTLATASVPSNISGFTISFPYANIDGAIHSTGSNIIVRLGNNAYANVNPWLVGAGSNNCTALAVNGTSIADGDG